MNRNNVLLCLFGILAYFAANTVARESIIGGHLANLESFRYVVSLLEVGHGHVCGGAIIGEQYILSAAHCFINEDNTFKNKSVIALMGTNDLLKFTKPSVSIDVAKIYVPREYNATVVNSIGDIAVLKLKESLHVVHHKNLKIVRQLRNQADEFANKKAIVAGWGWNQIKIEANKVEGKRTDSLLRWATAVVLDNEECQKEYHNVKITEDHLCARVEEHDHEPSGVCHGDDGSPLTYNGTLIGIQSKYPHGCNEKNKAAIYTRVSRYLTFIRYVKSEHKSDGIIEHVLIP